MNGLPEFLGRHDPHAQGAADDRLTDRTDSWLTLMDAGSALHPITRACMGFHLWALAGLGEHGGTLEAAVTAARIAAGDGSGAVFAPVGMGGAGGLRVSGAPAARFGSWLDGMESAIFAALRHLEQVEVWTERAQAEMARLSGRTPALLRRVLAERPLLSAPMAEALTGASRAAVQRNLAWMEEHGLIREITGQGRFRFWRAAV